MGNSIQNNGFLNVTCSYFAGNTSGYAGAILNAEQAQATIRLSAFEDTNSATSGLGGDIYNLNTGVQVDAEYNWWGDNGVAWVWPAGRVSANNALLGDPTDPNDPYFNPGCAQQQPDPTPMPAPNTCITQATETTVGVYIRQTPNMFDPNGSVNVRGGQLTVTGVYSNEQGLWLRVTGYTVGGIFTSSIGWVWRDVFAASDPCEVGDISSLPIMDDDGNPIATPVPVPTPTPVPPQPTPEFPAACRVWTSQPANIRYAWYSYSPSLHLIDQGTWVNVYAATDDGDMPPGTTSTNWYQVSFEGSTGTIYGWMHEAVLDSNLIHGPDCADIPWVERTLPPTNTPTPQPPTPTIPPDFTTADFVLPMRCVRLEADGSTTDLTVSMSPRLSSADVGGVALPSRDVNCAAGGNYEVVVPARATIIVVDNLFEPDQNFNQALGNFVAIRILMSDLPQPVRERIVEEVNTFCQLRALPNAVITDNQGAVYISFAHLESVEQNIIPSNPPSSFPIFEEGTRIGWSGDTGEEAQNVNWVEHLDITVFYLEDENIDSESVFGQSFPNGVLLRRNFNGYFSIGAPLNQWYVGDIYPIDPLALWPILQAGVNLEESFQQEVCNYPGFACQEE